MPLLSGAVSLSRFSSQLERRAPSEARRWLDAALERGRFEPLDPSRSDDDRAAGFVELEDHDRTAFAMGDVAHGEYALFGYRIDAIQVRAAELKAELARWASRYQAEHRRAPGRAEKKRAREELRRELRKRTPPSTRVLDVALHLRSGDVQIWGGSRKAVEEAALAVEGAFALTLEPRTVAAAAARAGLAGAALGPTAALVGLDLPAAREVHRVEE